MKYALIYGAIAGAIAIIVICVSLVTGVPDHSMLFGYLVMLVALSLIFVGVKRYRDVECGGVIRFGRALPLGLGIAAVAAAIYAIGWEVFLAVSQRDFIAEYSASMLEGMRADGASEAAIAAKAEEMGDMAVLYRNPLYRIGFTLLEILPVGLLVALVSAALLRDPRLLPAARN